MLRVRSLVRAEDGASVVRRAGGSDLAERRGRSGVCQLNPGDRIGEYVVNNQVYRRSILGWPNHERGRTQQGEHSPGPARWRPAPAFSLTAHLRRQLRRLLGRILTLPPKSAGSGRIRKCTLWFLCPRSRRSHVLTSVRLLTAGPRLPPLPNDRPPTSLASSAMAVCRFLVQDHKRYQ